MTKETKAERQMRETLERAKLRVELEQTWHKRLMVLMSRAQRQNFDLRVVNETFELYDASSHRTTVYQFELAYHDECEDEYNSLEWDVTHKEERAAESARQYAVKQNALSKLTKEERELLGL